MSFIKVDNITKTFKVAKRNSGLKAALKSFFKREYKIVEAVKNVSFEIKKGEVIGYIGPNGAGKSTTIKMLSGILLPTSGSIKINNLDPIKDRKKYVSKIGVVFGQRSQLAFDIPAEDTFDLLRDIYKIDNNEYQKTKKYLVELLSIEEIIKKPVRTLSLGERMRCEIASSLLHKPEILFLDEPTIGLDAISKKIVRDFIKKINKENKVTVILTTHDMNDIEALAKRIILIGNGKILYDGNIKTLKVKRWFLPLLSSAGRGSDISEEVLTPLEVKQFLIDIQAKTKTSSFIVNLDIPYNVLLKKQNKNIIAACPAAISELVIFANGDISPCCQVPVIAGNILKNDIYDIWNNSKIFNDFRNKSLVKGKCCNCKYLMNCGGCRANAYIKYNDYLEGDDVCWK